MPTTCFSSLSLPSWSTRTYSPKENRKELIPGHSRPPSLQLSTIDYRWDTRSITPANRSQSKPYMTQLYISFKEHCQVSRSTKMLQMFQLLHLTTIVMQSMPPDPASKRKTLIPSCQNSPKRLPVFLISSSLRTWFRSQPKPSTWHVWFFVLCVAAITLSQPVMSSLNISRQASVDATKKVKSYSRQELGYQRIFLETRYERRSMSGTGRIPDS